MMHMYAVRMEDYNVVLDTLERIRKRNIKTLFSMRAYGSASNLLPEHIGLPQKS